MGPIHHLLSADHARLDGLLQRACAGLNRAIKSLFAPNQWEPSQQYRLPRGSRAETEAYHFARLQRPDQTICFLEKTTFAERAFTRI